MFVNPSLHITDNHTDEGKICATHPYDQGVCVHVCVCVCACVCVCVWYACVCACVCMYVCVSLL